MGTLHAWESFGDGVAPDLQSVAKGLGGGQVGLAPIKKFVLIAVLDSPRLGPFSFLLKLLKEFMTGAGIGKHTYLTPRKFWRSFHRLHGHTYQAHPIASAAALAVQRVIASENLLALCRQRGDELEQLLKNRLQGPNARAAPYVSDIRGGGLFWGVEFNVPDAELPRINAAYQRSKKTGENTPNNRRFGVVLQNKTMDKGLVAIAMTGSVDGKRGDHLMLAPAYNITSEELQIIVDRVVESVEELLFD